MEHRQRATRRGHCRGMASGCEIGAAAAAVGRCCRCHCRHCRQAHVPAPFTSQCLRYVLLSCCNIAVAMTAGASGLAISLPPWQWAPRPLPQTRLPGIARSAAGGPAGGWSRRQRAPTRRLPSPARLAAQLQSSGQGSRISRREHRKAGTAPQAPPGRQQAAVAATASALHSPCNAASVTPRPATLERGRWAKLPLPTLIPSNIIITAAGQRRVQSHRVCVAGCSRSVRPVWAPAGAWFFGAARHKAAEQARHTSQRPGEAFTARFLPRAAQAAAWAAHPNTQRWPPWRQAPAGVPPPVPQRLW